MEVQVVSAEEELFSGEAEFIRTQTVEGEIGILAGHSPVLAQLVACETKVRTTSGEEKLFHIEGGFMTVKEDKVIILTAEGIS